MSARTFTWKLRGQTIKGQERRALSNPDKVICLVHGHGEHQGRYDHVVDFFLEKNIAVLTFDHPGHGISDGKRGHIKSYDDFHTCIDKQLGQATSFYPSVPKLLYGHSMGGNIVINYALRKKPDVEGYIITSPWLVSFQGPTAVQLAAAKVLRKIYPAFAQKTGLSTDALSHDVDVVRAYEEDPLVHSWMSTGLYFACMDAARHSLDNASQLEKPMLLLHGDEDRIADIKGAAQFAERAGFLVNYKPWSGAFHELHNEPQRVKVLSLIFNWIIAQR